MQLEKRKFLSNIMERGRLDREIVMVRGGKMIYGQPYNFEQRNSGRQRYRDEILKHYISLFRGAYRSNFLHLDNTMLIHIV